MRIHFLEKVIFGTLSAVLFGALVFVLAEYPAVRRDSVISQQSTVTASRNTQPGSAGLVIKNSNDSLEISAPQINAVISSPVEITGRARGWYFEGSFPITILDFNGKVLGKGLAVAQEDWMTGEFVDFKATINFLKPQGLGGTIKFEKDNPSGLSQNSEEFSLPINFTQHQF